MAFRSFRSSLLGSKPAEIINISFTDVNREEKINDIYKYLYKCKKIDFIVIDKEKKGLKILFVNKKHYQKN